MANIELIDIYENISIRIRKLILKIYINKNEHHHHNVRRNTHVCAVTKKEQMLVTSPKPTLNVFVMRIRCRKHTHSVIQIDWISNTLHTAQCMCV